MVVKIEFTLLSHSPDRKFFPFKKGFKKYCGVAVAMLVSAF